jgi:hypothetical protein
MDTKGHTHTHTHTQTKIPKDALIFYFKTPIFTHKFFIVLDPLSVLW